MQFTFQFQFQFCGNASIETGIADVVASPQPMFRFQSHCPGTEAAAGEGAGAAGEVSVGLTPACAG
jgi:hypothetical protein